MGRNKKEALVFTSVMCFFMVLFMCVYNVMLSEGFTTAIFAEAAVAFFPALAVALVLDIFVVGKIAKGLAFKLLMPDAHPVKKVLVISTFMVFGMALCMSLFGTLMHGGAGSGLLLRWLETYGLNLLAALPLQLLVVGPLTRFIFTRLYLSKKPAGLAS
ncbi:MAG: hypothetical protein K0Q90_3444 [Paenibacillaceae bacterium]|jgi:hypothetical protein|nr:hypothetical protein [Paenibacillaceae bacterium]